jgi:hypothetical protein
MDMPIQWVLTLFSLPGNMFSRSASELVLTIACWVSSFTNDVQVPINNACLQNQTVSTNMGFAGMSLEMAKPPTSHTKTTLPPSIYFPGEAEIRYYLKCTVNLPGILKQNPRAVSYLSHDTGSGCSKAA